MLLDNDAAAGGRRPWPAVGLIVIAAFKSLAVIAGFDGVTVVGQRYGGHLGVDEHDAPFSDGKIVAMITEARS